MLTRIKKLVNELTPKELVRLGVSPVLADHIGLWARHLRQNGYLVQSVLTRFDRPPQINGQIPHIFAVNRYEALIIHVISDPQGSPLESIEKEAALLEWRRKDIYHRGFVKTWPGAGIGGQVDHWGTPLIIQPCYEYDYF